MNSVRSKRTTRSYAQIREAQTHSTPARMRDVVPLTIVPGDSTA